MANDRKFRFGVQVSQSGIGARRGATGRARSKTSASRRCSCPTTSARSSRRCPRWRWPPRTPRRCGSARSCSTTTTSTRRSSPRKPRRSTSSRDGASSSGIGAGWMKTDYDTLGLPVRPARGARRPVRRSAAGHQGLLHRRAVQRVRASTTGSPTTASWPMPVQKPGPPILIGGGGKRVLSIAAREADIVGINPNLKAGRSSTRTQRRTR